jgi:hypothetical protein
MQVATRRPARCLAEPCSFPRPQTGRPGLRRYGVRELPARGFRSLAYLGMNTLATDLRLEWGGFTITSGLEPLVGLTGAGMDGSLDATTGSVLQAASAAPDSCVTPQAQSSAQAP